MLKQLRERGINKNTLRPRPEQDGFVYKVNYRPVCEDEKLKSIEKNDDYQDSENEGTDFW